VTLYRSVRSQCSMSVQRRVDRAELRPPESVHLGLEWLLQGAKVTQWMFSHGDACPFVFHSDP
jgi:hypothetical protein